MSYTKKITNSNYLTDQEKRHLLRLRKTVFPLIKKGLWINIRKEGKEKIGSQVADSPPYLMVITHLMYSLYLMVPSPAAYNQRL
jgi:hypothetical protein